MSELVCREYAGTSFDFYDEEVLEDHYSFPVMCSFLQMCKGTGQTLLHAPHLPVIHTMPWGGQLHFDSVDLLLLYGESDSIY